MPLIICNVSALPGVNTYLESIRSSWRRSQEDNQDTDLTLVSGAISVDVHQSVLLPLSTLLLDLVTSSSSCQCAKPAVTIPPVGQDALNALVDLLYVGRCMVESEQAKKRVEDLWALLRFRVPISCGGGDSREEPARNEEASMDEKNSAIASIEQPLRNNAEVMGPSEKKEDYVQQPEDGDHSSAKVKRKRKPSKKKVDALESIDSTSKRNPPRNNGKVRHRSAQDAECHGEDVTSNTEIMRRSNKPKVTMRGSSMPQATVVGSSTPRSEHYLQSDEPIIRGHGLPSACAPVGGMTINDVAMSTPNTTFTNQLPPSFPSPSEQKIKSTRSRQRTKRKTTEFWSTDKVANNNFPTSDGPSETASNVDANESEDGFDVHQDCYTVLKENHEGVVKETSNKLVILGEDDKGSSKVLEENGNLDTSSTVMDQVKSEIVKESSQGVTERIDTKHSVEESSQGDKERIDTKHPCLFCPKLFSNSLDLQGHLSLSHFKYEISRRYPGVICQYCKKSFVTKSGHVKHIGSVHKIIEGLLRVAGSTKLAKMKEVQMNLNGGINLKDDAH